MDEDRIDIEKTEGKNNNQNENQKETNYFTFPNLIKDMKIKIGNQIEVSLKDIIDFANFHDKTTIGYLYNDQSFPLIITNISKSFFSFNFCGIIGEKIFRQPIRYKHSNGQIYEFVSGQQFDNFLNTFNSPYIECNNCKGMYNKAPANLTHLNIHKKHDFLIIECFKYTKLKSEEFKQFFSNRIIDFINKEFETPISFEKNYNYYFNYHGKYKTNDKFYIYDDNNSSRSWLALDIITRKKKVLNFFGASGKGKSVTLIGVLKYRNSFDKIGTLYINCKTFKILLTENKISIIKQILIDEIIFLNPYDYSNYEKAVNLIKNFNFENAYSYWDLILNILNKCINNNINYIIAFDQYNNSQDIDNKLNEIKNKFRNNSNIKFVIFSSMNETDIRDLKIKFLFDELDCKDEEYYEIEKICQISDNNLTQEQQIALNKMGNSFKELNEIKSSSNINEYLKEKHFKLSKKIICFYLSSDAKLNINKYIDSKSKIILDIPPEILGKILIFTTGYIYDRNNLSEIIKFIPFRFFRITTRNKNNFMIEFGFPFIKEVMLSLYKKIILKNNYSVLKSILNNKGSGLGTLFELLVIHELTPTISPISKFKNFSISEKYVIPSIVKRDNEKNKINLKLILLKNKTYLIEQEQFNGKDLDLLIIDVRENDINIYGLQISIYKDKIFDKLYLKKSFSNMVNNINDIFGIDNFNHKNLYFGYIFDYSRNHDYLFQKMLSDFKNAGWKYFFFDPDKKIFCNKTNKEIYDINEVVTRVDLNDGQIFQMPLVFQNLFGAALNNNYLNIIKDLVKREKGQLFNNLRYKGELDGPITKDNVVNVLFLPQNIEVIFQKENRLVCKTIDKKTKEISDFVFGGISIGKYQVYELE